MRRVFLLISLFAFSLSLFSQNDNQAKQILDRTFSAINSSNGIKLTFKGSYSGELLMKKNKFYLSSDGIKTWFNGKNQWSYVAANDEVNVTTPSVEELQSINPYYLLSSYKSGFSYKFIGQKTINGKKVDSVLLTPLQKGNIMNITIFITTDNQPLMINIKEKNGRESSFKVTSYNSKLNLNDTQFTFDKSKYPDAEIIDLR